MTLDAIRARLAAATPGPWRFWDKRGRPLYRQPGPVLVGHTGPRDFGVVRKGGDNFTPWTVADADFIAHAPEDIATLLAIADAAAALLAARGAVERAVTPDDKLAAVTEIPQRWDALRAALEGSDG